MNNIVIFLLDKNSLGGIEQVAKNLEFMLSGSEYIHSVRVVDLVELRIANKNMNELGLCKKFLQDLDTDSIVLSLYDRLSIQLSFIRLLYNFKIKLVACQHADFFAHRPTTRFIRRFFYRFIDRTVCLTSFDNGFYLKQGIKSVVIHNSLLSFPVVDKEFKNRKNKVLAAGRLNKIKQFDKFIALAHHCKDLDFSFELFGEGEEFESLVMECQRLTLEYTEIIKGKTFFLYDELINTKYFIVTSQRESFSMVILEAMASGCVVISFDCPTGPRELIVDGVNGFLVDQGDIMSIRDKIIYLNNNPLVASDISSNAMVTARNYSPENLRCKWEYLFNGL